MAALFTQDQQRTLTHLAALIIEGAPASAAPATTLAERCAARLHTLPADKQGEFATALQVLGSRASVMLAIGRLTPFVALDRAAQARCFDAWAHSAVAPLRSAHQAIRKLVLAVHYSDPAVTAAIGYAGPLQGRAPEAPWEGPLPGEPRADEPVARGPIVLPTTIAPDPLPTGVVTGTSLAMDVERRADVVVIGTGAGGAVTAARLAEAGYEVVILEQGGWLTRSDFTEDEPALTERLYADGGLRATDDLSVSLVQGQTVGGSTTVNWMIMLRTPDFVLDEWARAHGVFGMSPAEMAPVFARIEQEVQARAVPDDAHSPNNRLILDGARTLGWRATTANINADQCIRCGKCGIGCRHNAKQSTLLTFLPRALAAGATLYANARVSRIERRERDTGTGTPALKRVHATVGGRTLTIDAPLVVVAGGAIETPALLQRSGMGGGGVGEWLRLHPTTAVMGHYDREILSNTGIPLSTMCDEFIQWQGTDYGFWIECPPMLPSLTAAAMPGFGPAHAARMQQYRQTGVLIALTRDGANTARSSGRVAVNRAGAVSIRYALTPEDRARVQASVVAAARLHLANGAKVVTSAHTKPITVRSITDLAALERASVAPNRMALFSAHVNGTCRMGTDPQRSGATPDGERHGVRGLYITDGSLLPTALGVNPQETIMAVATVLAERMAVRHSGMLRS